MIWETNCGKPLFVLKDNIYNYKYLGDFKLLLKILVSVVQFRPEPPAKPSLTGGFFGCQRYSDKVRYICFRVVDFRVVNLTGIRDYDSEKSKSRVAV